jgi:hypothetical protein
MVNIERYGKFKPAGKVQTKDANNFVSYFKGSRGILGFPYV